MQESAHRRLRSPIVVVLGHVDHGKCLHPKERVILGDGRPAVISSLYPEGLRQKELSNMYERIDYSLELITATAQARIKPAKATQMWRVKHKGYLLRVLLSDGSEVTVTPEHPFLTVEGWVPAEELSKGDLVAVAIKTNAKTSLKRALAILDEETAFGSYMKVLSGRDDFWQRFLYALGKALGGESRSFSELKSLHGETLQGFGFSQVVSSERKLQGEFTEAFLNAILLYSKIRSASRSTYIPSFIFALPKGLIKHFLRGYIVSAGEVDERLKGVLIRTTNRLAAEDLKILLTRFGVPATIKGEYNLTVVGKSGVQALSRILDIHTLAPTFLDGEEDSLPIKFKDLGFAEVKDIVKEAFKGYVYDFTVPSTESFVAGTVIVHNTTLLDKIRGTAVVSKEPGEMTQHVGASMIPSSAIERMIRPLKSMFQIKLTIPGLLFIDTPGHEAFSNLRRRGGSIADFAILVVDVMEGMKQQTKESIEILLSRKVPFVVAANKIDRLYGWKPYPNQPFMYTVRNQSKRVLDELERRIYTLIGQLGGLGIPAERFDRIKDFRKAIAIVPISAKTGEGIPELLAVLAGLTQKYLTKRIMFTEGPAKGVVLEVKSVTGLGTCIDAVIYDGILRRGDIIVVGGVGEPIVTKVRAILMPRPLEEMRVAGESEFMNVDEVVAAAGVRVSAPNLDTAIAGAPIYAVENESRINDYVRKVSEEVTQVRFSRDINGVVVKADTLGTLEAVVSLLEKKGVPVRLADVGPLRKNEVLEAAIVSKNNPYLGVILLFNVKPLPDAEELAVKEGVKIFQDSIIYRLLEKYDEWVKSERSRELQTKLQKTVFPAKIQVLPGYVFRRKDPAIVGVRVLAGSIRPGYPLMRNDGRKVGKIYQIQLKGKTVLEASKGDEVAISIVGNVLVGRHFDEGDVLYTDPSEGDLLKVLDEFLDFLNEDSLNLIKEIIKVKQKREKRFGLSVLFRLKQIKRKP